MDTEDPPSRIHRLELELEALRSRHGAEPGTIEADRAIDVNGIEIRWSPERGVCTFGGLPVAMMWVNSTLAGLLAGVQRMVGTERFVLALQSEGRNSVEDDWQVISQFPDFRDGFAAIANVAAVAGWGRWELLDLDREKQTCAFRVYDSGPGISKDDLEHIFEPFYSKKILGRSGTGLGLAVVWNTVQDHKGYINVDSSPAGSRFDIYLPATREDVAVTPAPLSIESYRGSGQTILVVDDEATQRDIACRMLTHLGYEASAAANGAEAIALRRDRPFDLLVLDMIMPGGMGGRQTFERIVAHRPGQRAVIASGFAETDEVRETQRLGAGAFIRKPYTLEQLGLAIRSELIKP